MGEHQKHRSFMLKILDKLDSEEIKDMEYYCEMKKESQGRSDLLRHLEGRNIVGLNRYEVLYAYFQDRQRIDICEMIAEHHRKQGMLIPLGRKSLQSIQQNSYHYNSGTLEKINKMKKCKRELKAAANNPDRIIRFDSLFVRLLSTWALTTDHKQTHTSPLSQDTSVIEEGLIHLSQFWAKWPATLAQFQHSGDNATLLVSMKTCHKTYDTFDECLPQDWEVEIRKKTQQARNEQHPVGIYARNVHKTLQDLTTEILKKVLKDSDDTITKYVFALESVNYTARYLLPIFEWLKYILQSVVSSAVEGKLLLVLSQCIENHWAQIARNESYLIEIFGVELIDKVKEELQLGQVAGDIDIETHDMATYTALLGSTAITWHVTLIGLYALAMGYKTDVKVEHVYRNLQKHLAKHKGEIRCTYNRLSQRMACGMTREVEEYQENFEKLFQNETGCKFETRESLGTVLNEREVC